MMNKAYIVTAKVNSGKRLGAIARTKEKISALRYVNSTDGILIIIFEVSGIGMQIAVLVNEKTATKKVKQTTEAYAKQISPKLMDFEILEIDFEDFLDCFAEAIRQEFISKEEQVFIDRWLTKNALSEEDARRFLVEKALESGVLPTADLLELVRNYGEYHYRNELLAHFSQWQRQSDPKNETLVPEGGAVSESLGMAALNQMVGLHEAKKIVREIAIYASVVKRYRRMNGPSYLNIALCGDSGSGKTKLADVLGLIFFEAGITKKKEIIVVDRAELVGQYVGHTAPRTKSIFKKAKEDERLIFIDECYQLLDDRNGSFGDECINTIVQEMENNPEVIVVFAGYPKRMEEFINHNEGLRSRIKFIINLPDYSPEELFEILMRMAKKKGFDLKENVRAKVLPIFEEAVKQENSGNGRLVRNLIERAELKWAARVSTMEQEGGKITKHDLNTLIGDDFAAPEVIQIQEKRIGFLR